MLASAAPANVRLGDLDSARTGQAQGASTIHLGPSAKVPRYESLDAWRGAACLAVVVFHQMMLLTRKGQDVELLSTAGPLAKAFLGIAALMELALPMFFVISGYGVTASADNIRGRNGAMKMFFWRRLRRVYPPYWAAIALALLVYWVSSMFGHPIHEGQLDRAHVLGSLTAWNWIGTLTITEGWRYHVVGGESRWFLTHAWTLGLEEQFYAITAIILGFLPRKFFVGFAAVTAGVFVVALAFGPKLDGFFLEGQWVFFALGILAYYWATLKEPRRKHRILLGSTLVLSTAVLGTVAPFTYVFACLFVALLIVLRRFDGRFVRSAVLRPFLWVGKISYSLYLTHIIVAVSIQELLVPRIRATWPAGVVIAVVTTLGIAVSVALAWLFYTHVEHRFLASSRQQSSLSGRR